MRVLYIGDVVGKPGRRLVKELVPLLRDELALDAVVANAENAAGGFGLTIEIARDLLTRADVLTTGNHVWQKKEFIPFLDSEPRIVRPANYPAPCPGRGACRIPTPAGELAVLQLEGRVFMKALGCPFLTAEEELAALGAAELTLVDIHAEATSEKQALAWYLDGKVSAVCGTHTHVMTADERLLPGGTAYITDVGMCGPMRSVIGMEIDASVARFLSQRPGMHDVAKGDPVLHAVLIEARAGRATRIERVVRALPAME